MIWAVLAEAVTGLLSGAGIGGGTLLMIYLTALGVPVAQSRGTNLLYFPPCSIAALISHIKNGLVEKRAVIPAVLTGTVTTLAASWFAAGLDADMTQKIFGAFLIILGAAEFFRK